jgi:ParB/RepB/Spo0J family partition protein
MSSNRIHSSSKTISNSIKQVGSADTEYQDSQDILEPLLAYHAGSHQDIPIERISPNPYQARKHFDDTALEELAASIRIHGILESLRVRPDPKREGFFQTAYGERRLRAASLAGLSVVPCDISEYTDEELAEIGMIENIQRAELEPLEEASMFRHLIDYKDPITHKKKHSIRRLAQQIGKPKNYIEDRLALLDLPEDVKEVLLVQPRASLRALIEVAKLPTPEDRASLVKKLKEGIISTEEVRTLVARRLEQIALPTEETEHLTFQRTLNRAKRRIESAMRELEQVASAYQAVPSTRNRELLLECINEVTTKVQQVKGMLP